MPHLHAAFLQAATSVADAAPTTWLSLGVGGALAGMMFYFYRQDRVSSETRLAGIIADFRSIIESNTKAMTAVERAVGDRDDHEQDARREIKRRDR